MKKSISLIAISLITASLLFGCKAKTTDNQNSTAQNNQSQGNFNGKGQFQRADISGQVVSIKGSQITIKVIKQPQLGQQGGNNGSNNTGNSNNNNSNSNSNSSSNSNAGGNNGNGGNQGTRQRRQLEFTGESKTITVPDGTPITTMVRGNQGRETKQLQVKDVKADDILQIWYADKDKGTVSKISVQEYGSNGNTGNANNSTTTN